MNFLGDLNRKEDESGCVESSESWERNRVVQAISLETLGYRYNHFPLVSKRQDITSIGEDLQKKEPL